MYLKKINSRLTLPENLRQDGLGLHYAVSSMSVSGTGTINTKTYTQFNNIYNIGGTGGGIFRRASSKPTNDVAYDIPAANPSQKGSIRLNPISKTFEGYNGSEWLPLH